MLFRSSFMKENLQKEDYNTSFRGFKEYEIDKVQRDLDIMRQGLDEYKLNTDMIRFAQYVDELDFHRYTNFKKTFPEMVEYYERCKELECSN